MDEFCQHTPLAGKTGKFWILVSAAIRKWKFFLNYYAFNGLNTEKLKISQAGICFSHYLTKRIGGGHVILHGSEPAIFPPPDKKDARTKFGLPDDKRIALAFGFMTITKGWDVLLKMNIPEGWIVVVNSSDPYNTENLNTDFVGNKKIINLQRGFLSDQELSLLFFASDAVILPYKAVAGSGVMFDALAHGLPFVATDLEFFKEFASYGLGITVKRTKEEFSRGIKALDRDYKNYSEAAKSFSSKLKWNLIANQHASIYNSVVETNASR